MKFSIFNIFLVVLCLGDSISSSNPTEMTHVMQNSTVINFEYGKSLKMACYTNHREQADVKWVKNGISLKPSHRIKFSQADTQHIINITKSVYEDAGHYSCGVTVLNIFHALGNITAVSDFRVELPQIQVIKESETLTIQCNITGKPTPNIYWRHETAAENRTIKQSSGRYKLSDINGTKNAQLSIANMQQKDVGYLLCVGTSPYVSAVNMSECTIRVVKCAPWWPFTAIIIEVCVMFSILWYTVNRCYERKEAKPDDEQEEEVEDGERSQLNEPVKEEAESEANLSGISQEDDDLLNTNIILINVYGSCPLNSYRAKKTTL